MILKIFSDKIFAKWLSGRSFFGRNRSHRPSLSDDEKRRFRQKDYYQLPKNKVVNYNNKVPECLSIRKLHKRHKGKICEDLKCQKK